MEEYDRKGVVIMSAIDKLIQIANAEVGYLEKSSNSQLDSKTANAGTARLTTMAATSSRVNTLRVLSFISALLSKCYKYSKLQY